MEKAVTEKDPPVVGPFEAPAEAKVKLSTEEEIAREVLKELKEIEEGTRETPEKGEGYGGDWDRGGSKLVEEIEKKAVEGGTYIIEEETTTIKEKRKAKGKAKMSEKRENKKQKMRHVMGRVAKIQRYSFEEAAEWGKNIF